MSLYYDFSSYKKLELVSDGTYSFVYDSRGGVMRTYKRKNDGINWAHVATYSSYGTRTYEGNFVIATLKENIF